MAKITRANISKFLKKHSMPVDQLSKIADTPRWSLRRFLKNGNASITLKTAVKLEEAMEKIDRGGKCTKKE